MLSMLVDLPRWKFPNRRPDRHPLLADENKLLIRCDGSNHHCAFSMADCPVEGFRSSRRRNSHPVHLKMGIGERGFAGQALPPVFVADKIVETHLSSRRAFFSSARFARQRWPAR